MNRLNIYKTDPNITLPKFATKQSACFDISFQAEGKALYHGYNKTNAPFSRPLSTGSIRIMPGDRILVPTGLIFDIPAGYSLRIHPRSGLSYKQGLVLANLEAVIDSDYVEETFIILTNTTEVDQTIFHGDRIAQAELVKQEEYVLWEIHEAPTQKTDRAGGLGSTGVAVFDGKDMTKNITMTKEEAAKVSIPLEETVKRGRGRPKKVA